ncbi:polyprenyl synthetase family protein [Streptomyces lateritius]|nr:polyprenyl synthetase family protein [Streptomyces lateritius]
MLSWRASISPSVALSRPSSYCSYSSPACSWRSYLATSSGATPLSRPSHGGRRRRRRVRHRPPRPALGDLRDNAGTARPRIAGCDRTAQCRPAPLTHSRLCASPGLARAAWSDGWVWVVGSGRDDYLDLFGDADTMDKQTGTDLRDGKHSYTVRPLLAAFGVTSCVDDLEQRRAPAGNCAQHAEVSEMSRCSRSPSRRRCAVGGR